MQGLICLIIISFALLIMPVIIIIGKWQLTPYSFEATNGLQNAQDCAGCVKKEIKYKCIDRKLSHPETNKHTNKPLMA